MSARSTGTAAWVTWAAGFGIWTLVGLSFASQFYLSSSKAGLAVSWSQAVAWALGDWYVFALLSLPVFRLARWFRLEGARWRQHLPVHMAACVVFSLLYVVSRAGIAQVQGRIEGSPVSFRAAAAPLLLKTFHFNLLIYWVIVSVSHALDYYRQSQERALRAAELEKRLAQAKLQSLQMQLNPHFLFNALNAISSLMHKDVEEADRMLASLSRLLRTSLDRTDEHEIGLQEEIAFLRRYLEIEQTRFGRRLQVTFDLAPGVETALVPNLVLQPLVENAIKHGIERMSGAGEIHIRAARADAGPTLVLEVEDNGPGLPGGRPTREGVGLANTRARLRELYGPAHRFEFNPAQPRGLRVRIEIPWQSPGSRRSPDSPATS